MSPTAPQELDSLYPLPSQSIDFFRENGFVKLKQVLSPDVVAHYGEEISRKVLELNPLKNVPMAERSTYKKAFIQITNLWQKSEAVRAFSCSKRLAQIAASLMGTRGVRMYHDQALFKEPGGGLTPWHADQFYWPLATEKCCTVWIPLQATPLEMGPLAFAAKSHHFQFGRDLEISDDSERLLREALARENFRHVEEPFELGEVSYHYGYTFHRAGGNATGAFRKVMTVIYMDMDMHLLEDMNEKRKIDWQAFCPGVAPGALIDSPLNPVLYEE